MDPLGLNSFLFFLLVGLVALKNPFPEDRVVSPLFFRGHSLIEMVRAGGNLPAKQLFFSSLGLGTRDMEVPRVFLNFWFPLRWCSDDD